MRIVISLYAWSVCVYVFDFVYFDLEKNGQIFA